MTTDTGEPTLTIDELAARAGTTVRTVRFYSTKGLLPPPVIGARRVGHYGPEHLSRLALITVGGGNCTPGSVALTCRVDILPDGKVFLTDSYVPSILSFTGITFRVP